MNTKLLKIVELQKVLSNEKNKKRYSAIYTEFNYDITFKYYCKIQ